MIKYIDDITVYSCTYRFLDDHNLAAGLTSDLFLKAQWGKLAGHIQLLEN